jgi:hypothetical protein
VYLSPDVFPMLMFSFFRIQNQVHFYHDISSLHFKCIMKRQISNGNSCRTLSKQRGADESTGYSSVSQPSTLSEIPAIPELPAFVPQESLGFWSWKPKGNEKAQFSHVTHTDVLDCVNTDAHALPDELKIPAGVYPKRYYDRSRPNQPYNNVFPNDPGYIVPLYVAVKRGLELSDIDFLLGGSSLNTLATHSYEKNDGTMYLTQKVENVIIVCKNKQYKGNKSDFGFQFERFVTGGRFEVRADPTIYENLHIMDIGGFKVLFSAEADAIEYELDRSSYHLVEIKAGNPKNFRQKVFWQMVSSGAQTLVQADKRNGMLTGVTTKSIQDMV